MARLTEAKMDRWRKQLVKASHIVISVRHEVNDVRHSATGGRLQAIEKPLARLHDANIEVGAALQALIDFQERENRIKG